MTKMKRFLRMMAMAAVLAIGLVFLLGAAQQTENLGNKPATGQQETKEKKDKIEPPEFPYLDPKRPPEGTPGLPQDPMTVTSTGFADRERIPDKYTCEGENLSPDLAWDNVPTGTAAFAIICDDPTKRDSRWDHWAIFNIPPSVRSLPEGVTPETDLGFPVNWCLNSWQRMKYDGPCPPPGDETHRYHYRIFALSKPVELPDKVLRSELLETMRPTILGWATLVGTYSR